MRGLGPRLRRRAVASGLSVAARASALLALPVQALQPADAHRLKAHYLYQFTLFTEWPASSDGPFRLCVLGSDPLGGEIRALQGKPVGQRRVDVVPRRPSEPLRDCELVFLASTAIDRLPQMLDELRGAAVLTVSDSPGAARQGVMLNMAVNPGRITFEANLGAAQVARLRLDTRLLRMVTRVRP